MLNYSVLYDTGGVNGYEEVVGSDNEDYTEGLVDDDSEEEMSPGSRAVSLMCGKIPKIITLILSC